MGFCSKIIRSEKDVMMMTAKVDKKKSNKKVLAKWGSEPRENVNGKGYSTLLVSCSQALRQ